MDIFSFYCNDEKKGELKSILEAGAQLHPEGLGEAFLEKDIWVTEILRILFDENILEGKTVAFKGGTALSKRWRAIERFSEDIDLSIHWHDLIDDPREEDVDWDAINISKSQQRKFRDNQQKRLESWTIELVERLTARLSVYDIKDLTVTYDAESKGEKVLISYPSVTTTDNQYHLDYVLLEFGGRNRGKPTEPSKLTTYLSEVEQLSTINFPTAKKVMVFCPGYIVWEKLTALHQFCTQDTPPNATRLARHWYDVDCIIEKNIIDPLAVDEAMNDVVKMKSARWTVKGVDFSAASGGGLQILPTGDLLTSLEEDHVQMIEGGMYFKQPANFTTILNRLELLQHKINGALSK